MANSKEIINSKHQARLSYANRKIYNWIKWKLDTTGRIKYTELIDQRKLYKLED